MEELIDVACVVTGTGEVHWADSSQEVLNIIEKFKKENEHLAESGITIGMVSVKMFKEDYVKVKLGLKQ